MRVGVIIPDRGDRPRFLENCLRMLRAQTLQPEIIELVNDLPLSSACDITYRYRIGYDRLRNKNLDIIAFIENDDWYSPHYLEIMVTKWEEHGKPNMIGTDYTIYYHIKLFSYFTFYHSERSSAMSTLIKPDMEIDWGLDHNPYTDMHLWFNVKKTKIFHPENYICLGIKHGVGMLGGMSHVDKLDRYINSDQNHGLLKCMDPESFDFYTNYFKS